jgi:SAM-dependent methyltransferase
MANPNAAYWDQGLSQVERMTGLGRAPSAAALAGADIRDLCVRFAIPLPVDRLLDIGCGTGRLSALATSYFGVDISASAIAYCHQRHIAAALVNGPDGLAALPDDGFDWVWACSVFTHIGREEQQQYLRQTIRLAPRLLVDILPGDPGCTPARWGTDEVAFRADLDAVGYRVFGQTDDVVDGSGSHAPRHRYFIGDRR